MQTFEIKGGIHPESWKDLASEEPVRRLPIPALLYVPLQQHVGAESVPIVAVGDTVGKGQVISVRLGSLSAAQHAPTSGRVASIDAYTAPHASGLSLQTIVIEADGLDRWAALPEPIADPFSVPPQEIVDRVGGAGIVGLGGAIFPAAVKLGMSEQYELDTLLINGAECEPYIACDDRLMREHADEVIDGARIMACALGVGRILIAVENNKPQAITRLQQAAAAFPEIRIVRLPARYPVGYAQHLTKIVTGREVPAEHRNAEVGVVVHNVATARAVHRAVRKGEPLISRIVTVTGSCIKQPSNLEVPIGARVSDLIANCGGLIGTPEQVVLGGPMMGQALPSLDVPVVKGSGCVLALGAKEMGDGRERPCIRCGRCVEACPSGLEPMALAALIRKDKLEAAAKLFVADCIACGSCAWVCPSYIPLVQYFNYANGVLGEQARTQRKHERTRTLSEARAERLESQEKAKREAGSASAGRTEVTA